MTALPDVEDLLAEAVAAGTVPHAVVVVADMDGVACGWPSDRGQRARGSGYALLKSPGRPR